MKDDYQKQYKMKNKEVLKEKRREYEKRNAIKQSQRKSDHKLKIRYGITRDQYNLILGIQEGLCAICGKQHSLKQPLHVDHCHNSNQIRGLLCGNCNRAIGLFKDDVELLRQAIIYIKNGK